MGRKKKTSVGIADFAESWSFPVEKKEEEIMISDEEIKEKVKEIFKGEDFGAKKMIQDLFGSLGF